MMTFFLTTFGVILAAGGIYWFYKTRDGRARSGGGATGSGGGRSPLEPRK